MKKLFSVLSVFALGLFFCGDLTADPFGPRTSKKIIEFGWDNPTPEYLDRNLEQIEMYVPHDGVGIDISKVITRPDGKKDFSTYYTFSKVPFPRDWYKSDIEHLKKAHARAKHLRFNFLRTVSTSFINDYNGIFDDEFWDIVCRKYNTFAWVAKQGGCAGICLDLEDYAGHQRWSYSPSCGHSWDEAWNKARERGRQWMNAIAKEYPDITIFFFFSLDLAMGDADGSPFAYERLSSSSSGLLAAFINGIYDVLPSGAKIVDGMESYSYGVRSRDTLYKLKAIRENRFRQLLTPENRKKYHVQGRLAYGAYLENYNSGNWQKYMKEAGLTPTQFFRRNFAWSVQYSDEFVWTWSESRKWYPVKFPHSWQEKTLARYPEIPTPYMGMALPGIEEAVRCARDPWNYAVDRLKSGSFANLLKNPGFENGSAYQNQFQTPDSKAVPELQPWETWQKKYSRGSFSLAKGEGIGGGNALLTRGVVNGCTLQSLKIDPCGLYVVRACAKIKGKCGASLHVQWRNEQRKWHSHLLAVSAPFDEDLGNGWKRATLVIRNIPEATGYMSVLLYSRAGNPDDAVLFDNVEIFNIFEQEPGGAPHLREALEKWRKTHAAAKKAKVGEALKDEKKSPVAADNKVRNGNFQQRGAVIPDASLPEAAMLFNPFLFQGYALKGPSKPRFFAVLGRDAGYSDDSAAVIVGGNGCLVFPVNGIKPGQKYRIRARAKVVGSGTPSLQIYWSSKRVKGPFDYQLGIPKFAFSEKDQRNWMTAEGVVTVPDIAAKFSLIPTASGLKNEEDRIFFDDLEAVLIP